jgi:putative DNA primase/helicase
VRSLSISKGKKHEIVWRCHAGCDQGSVGRALGFTVAADGQGRRELEESLEAPPNSNPGVVVAEYPYLAADGELVHTVYRLEPKSFRQSRPRTPEDTPEALKAAGIYLSQYDDESVWTLKGVKERVLYRLPQLLSSSPSLPVYVVEGEKDADRLAKEGLIATTSVSGASAWQPHYAEWLRDRDVVILPDNDEPGEKHAFRIAESLKGVAAAARIVRLPGLPPKGDVSDYLDAGGTVEELEHHVRQVPYIFQRARVWSPLALMEATGLPVVDSFLGGEMISRGGLTLIAGRRKVGKTHVTLRMAECFAHGADFGPYRTKQGKVLYVSQEMNESAMQRRLRKSFSREELHALDGRLHVVCRKEGLDLSTDAGALVLRGLIEELGVDVVFVDALRDIKGGARENDNDEMGAVFGRIRDDVASPTNTAIVIIHHKGKPREDGTTAGGRGASSMEDVVADILYLDHRDDRKVLVFEATREAEPQDDLVFDIYKDDETGLIRVHLSTDKPADDTDLQRAVREIVAAGGELLQTDLWHIMNWKEYEGRRKVDAMRAAGTVKTEKRAGRWWVFTEKHQQPLEEAS